MKDWPLHTVEIVDFTPEEERDIMAQEVESTRGSKDNPRSYRVWKIQWQEFLKQSGKRKPLP